jgi:thiol-disulfide isomerase/thioredoxin
MKTLLACGLVASLALFSACGGEEDPMDDPPDAGGGGTPDADPGTARAYPDGPYGEGTGDTIRNLSWVAYVDTEADSDIDPFNEEPQLFDLSQYYRGNDPEAKVIMINAAAGWCGPCMNEAAHFEELRSVYEPLGARFVSGIFEDADGLPADEAFVLYWGNQFDLTIPAAVDSLFQLGAYFDVNAMPMNMLVDAHNMEILSITVGTGGDPLDPLAPFRDILDYYTAQP